MINENASALRMLEHPVEIIDARGKSWFGRRSVGRNYTLRQGDVDLATIETRSSHASGSLSYRTTEVSFPDGSWLWTISTGGTGPRTTQIAKATRAVTVAQGRDDGEYGRELARWEGPAKDSPSAAAPIRLTHRSWGNRLEDGATLEVKRTRAGFELTVSAPVPLAVALLLWHVEMGDVKPAPPAPGEGKDHSPHDY